MTRHLIPKFYTKARQGVFVYFQLWAFDTLWLARTHELKNDFSRADWSRAMVDELHRKVRRRLEGNLSNKLTIDAKVKSPSPTPNQGRESLCIVCYTAVFSVVTQRNATGGPLRDDTKNGLV